MTVLTRTNRPHDIFNLRLLQTFAGAFQKKKFVRALFFWETTTNYISVQRLLNAELDKIISYVSYPSANTKHIKLIPYKSEHLLKSVPARQKNNKQIETRWNNTSHNSIIVTYSFIS